LKNQLTQIVIKLLNENSIIYDKKELEFQIKSHPSYPSLHSITGVLNHFNIENIAAKVEAEESIINKLPSCFIAQISGDNGTSLVTVKRKSNEYTIYNGVVKSLDLIKEDFIKKFTGIIVAVEENEIGLEKKNTDNVLEKSLITLLLLITSYFIYKANYTLGSYIYLVLSIIGVTVNIVIIKQELGIQTTIGDAFCSSTKKNKDCDAVLTSKGAEIFKTFKLSDLSLIYFVTLFTASFILGITNNLLVSISLISLPVVVYSIYYQYFIIKSWCFLCLTIGVVLIIQACIAYLSLDFSYNFQLNEILLYIFIVLITFLSWTTLKPYILEIRKLRIDKIKASKFQKNFTIFKSLLKSKVCINTIIPETDEIIYGNENSSLEILVITNPFCGHCKAVHSLIENILKKHANDVKIIFRFNVKIDEQESDLKHIVTRLYELYFKEGKEKCLLAMHDLYEGMSPKNWFNNYGKSDLNENYIESLKNEKRWCIENNINFTPELLINGNTYPKEYDRNDLLFFMEDLIEEQ